MRDEGWLLRHPLYRDPLYRLRLVVPRPGPQAASAFREWLAAERGRQGGSPRTEGPPLVQGPPEMRGTDVERYFLGRMDAYRPIVEAIMDGDGRLRWGRTDRDTGVSEQHFQAANDDVAEAIRRTLEQSGACTVLGMEPAEWPDTALGDEGIVRNRSEGVLCRGLPDDLLDQAAWGVAAMAWPIEVAPSVLEHAAAIGLATGQIMVFREEPPGPRHIVTRRAMARGMGLGGFPLPNGRFEVPIWKSPPPLGSEPWAGYCGRTAAGAVAFIEELGDLRDRAVPESGLRVWGNCWFSTEDEHEGLRPGFVPS